MTAIHFMSRVCQAVATVNSVAREWFAIAQYEDLTYRDFGISVPRQNFSNGQAYVREPGNPGPSTP